MSSRIEQIIDEIEEYIDNCKFQPLSTTKIIVNKDQIDELLRELRMKTPEEIKNLTVACDIASRCPDKGRYDDSGSKSKDRRACK